MVDKFGELESHKASLLSICQPTKRPCLSPSPTSHSLCSLVERAAVPNKQQQLVRF
eukprot:m.219062 g.219062  ORF g.219062 m.219062 type:complete len:56 (-) comp15105_c8_seq1:94-261(-)